MLWATFLFDCVRFVAQITAISNDGWLATDYFYSTQEIAVFLSMALVIAGSVAATALSNSVRVARLEEMAARDSLTGLLNRAAFTRRADQILRHSYANGRPVTLVVADLDQFKSINDTFGHPVGDTVLKSFSAACTESLRSEDLIGRIGGEEFAILLKATTADEAISTLGRINEVLPLISSSLIPGFTVTSSYGVSDTRDGSASLDVLLVRADAALYRAKAAGKNRMSVWQGPLE